MRMQAVDTYMLFLALKNHFTIESYDFFKYHGKVSASRDSFLGRKDQYQFQKLSRVCDSEEMVDYIVANLSNNPKVWVGELLTEDAQARFKEYVRMKQSFTYSFTKELDKLLGMVHNPKDIFKVPLGNYPVIIDAMLTGDVSIQTVAVLNDFIPFLLKFDEKIEDAYLYPKLASRIRKLRPFITYDKNAILKVMKEKLSA